MTQKKNGMARVIPSAANDNGGGEEAQHLRTIAHAIGHHIARQHYLAWEKKQRRAANDNSPATLGEEIKGQGPKG
ncbi:MULTISPECIES: hypothetical protein [Thalassospira]|uniref:hypothetical protein n=1 Tax=Thalassospira TaxID=168934 RepID=UPI0008DE5C96|nr:MULTISPECIES: hypothetical protein [Thalassospira]MDM7978207.1 hypothetical protein [Thalassospira xiamenensis]OHY98983.1 hypothetical protein BC440_13425 [Thalassospira sp. MIT1004]|tara:strand:- start:736 stop:960 length:225 start_codon:yes stop_codon:yes gene_type:complete